MDRAYSLLQIKTVSDDARVIEGIASTPEPDRMGDVVEPMGAKFAVPLPLLWQHDHNQPVGHVEFAKPTKAGIPFKARIERMDEPGQLKDRLDLAWQSVKAGLVRAVSIGFRAIEAERLKDGLGMRFKQWEWLELSLVTVPANSQATITAVKAIDREFLPATGQGNSGQSRPGASGKFVSLISKEQTVKKTYQEQIKDLEATRAAKVAQAEGIMEKSLAEGRTSNDAEGEEFDTVTAEIKSIDADLDRLRMMDKLNIQKAAPVGGGSSKEAAESRITHVSGGVRTQEKTEPGIRMARYVMALGAARGDHFKAYHIAQNHYGHDEALVNTLKFQAESGRSLEMIMKANVNAGTTTDATWASPLVQYNNFAGDFLEYLRPQTIIGQIENRVRRIPFNVRIAGQTSGGSGYWVGEGAPKPLTKFDFNATELRWAKVAAIAVLTEELMRFSSPSAERLVRDALVGALRERLDRDFIDPGKAAVANVSPASITNGITPISASGSGDAEDIRRDIRALWAPFIAANNPPTSAVYIMTATTALALSLMTNTLGQAEFPGLTMNGGTLGGVPVIVSEYLDNAAGSAGGIVVLVNASDIWLADDGDFTVDASREASLQMDDAPTNNSGTGTEASLVSMFQTNSVAIRAERMINWARRRTSAVSWLDTVSWGQA